MIEHTDNIEHIASAYCNSKEEVKVMYEAFETALRHYQWYYQNASEKKFVTVSNQTRKAVEITLNLLRYQGHDSLIGEIEYALQDSLDDSTLTKSKILTQAKQIMKSIMTKVIKPKLYDEDFGKRMGKAFVEYCETFPLDESPAHFDLKFDPKPDYDSLRYR